MEPVQDVAVIGGGLLGCTVALHLARGGMRTAVLERRNSLCTQATAVNTGNISIMWTRPYLVPYAMRARDLWATTADWLGMDCGFHTRGGLKLAFTEQEAASLERSVAEIVALGAPVDLVDMARAREIEPGLGPHVVRAAYCGLDGYANATITGRAFGPALQAAGVEVRAGVTLQTVERDDAGFTLRLADGVVRARRVVVAGGVWIEEIMRLFGVDLPILCRVSQVTVTERMKPLFHTVLGASTGVLSLKQSDNGTVLIGGGWQGIGDPARGPVEHVPDNLLNNLRLAQWAVPALENARVVRSWLGLEARAPDLLPLAGPVPGVPDAWVIGAIDTGYTIGPYLGQLLAQSILEQEPELPLFDPARLLPGAAPVPQPVH